MEIGIKEPFLKLYADGTIGIRVDRPSDIIYVTPICKRRGCGVAQSAQQRLLTCSRCRKVEYCSKACQRAAWCNGHKHACVPPREAVMLRVSNPQLNPGLR
eukprot:459065-Rhodomonas_salina.2